MAQELNELLQATPGCALLFSVPFGPARLTLGRLARQIASSSFLISLSLAAACFFVSRGNLLPTII